jgi:adenylate cyclase
LRQLGREIGAHYVLAGSLRRSEERMRATAQLVEVESGREMWAERYDRRLADHFDIQDELTQAIVARIEHVLVAAAHQRAIACGLGEPSLNQKAGWHLFRFTREDNATAIKLLRQAIADNPNADRRYQGLALALGLDLAFGWTNGPDETIAEMLAAAERSVSLAEQDAWNHAPLSWALMFGSDYQRAIAQSARMIELNPNSGVSYGVSAIVLAHCGKPDAALDMLDKARRMAPQAPFMFNYLCAGAIALYRLGRYREAAEMAESAALRRPNFFQPQLVLAAATACAGEIARAELALAVARRIAPDMSAPWLKPLIPLREAGDFALLIEGLRKAGWEHSHSGQSMDAE